ncbi:MAG: hypothetical protein IBX63_02315 [Coriobacteriia bacterium]|nr:hypothetical protein [Coriobacteriia bacterium]
MGPALILPFTAYAWYVVVLVFGYAGVLVFVNGAKDYAASNQRPTALVHMVSALLALVLYFVVSAYVSWLLWFLVYVEVGALGVKGSTIE